MNTTDTTVTSHEGNETANTDIEYTQPELTDAANETPIFVPPSIPPMKEPGIPTCAESVRKVLKTKQDVIWVEDASGQWALDFDCNQPNVEITSIDYVDGTWKAKGKYEETELTWVGPAEESASTGKFTDPTSIAPAFTASRIIPLPARATQSDAESPNEKRIATMAAVRKTIENGVIKDLENKVSLEMDSNDQHTAVTLGSRSKGKVGQSSFVNGSMCDATNTFAHCAGDSCSATGKFAHAEGKNCAARGDYSHAEGQNTVAVGSYSFAGGNSSHSDGPYSIALGHYTRTGDNSATHRVAFTWNGDESTTSYFCSHGNGTFNLNPKGGILGFYIGDLNLQQIIDARVKELVKTTATDAGE